MKLTSIYPRTCIKCSRVYKTRGTFYKHKQICLNQCLYKCEKCLHTYKTKANFWSHKKKCSRIRGYDCLKDGCSYSSNTKESVISHMQKEHNMKSNVELYTFQNKVEFEAWKDKESARTFTRFIQITGENKRRTYFHCHFGIKRKNSMIPFYNCYSRIMTKTEENNTISVRYYPNHTHDLRQYNWKCKTKKRHPKTSTKRCLGNGEPKGKMDLEADVLTTEIGIPKLNEQVPDNGMTEEIVGCDLFNVKRINKTCPIKDHCVNLYADMCCHLYQCTCPDRSGLCKHIQSAFSATGQSDTTTKINKGNYTYKAAVKKLRKDNCTYKASTKKINNHDHTYESATKKITKDNLSYKAATKKCSHDGHTHVAATKKNRKGNLAHEVATKKISKDNHTFSAATKDISQDDQTDEAATIKNRKNNLTYKAPNKRINQDDHTYKAGTKKIRKDNRTYKAASKKFSQDDHTYKAATKEIFKDKLPINEINNYNCTYEKKLRTEGKLLLRNLEDAYDRFPDHMLHRLNSMLQNIIHLMENEITKNKRMENDEEYKAIRRKKDTSNLIEHALRHRIEGIKRKLSNNQDNCSYVENFTEISDKLKLFASINVLKKTYEELTSPFIFIHGFPLSIIELKSLETNLTKKEEKYLNTLDKSFLSGWLCDSVIDACISSLLNGNQMFSYIESSVAKELADLNSCTIHTQLERGANNILVPINPGNHWILLHFNLQSKETSVLDPVKFCNSSVFILSFINKFISMLKSNREEWRIMVRPHVLQDDAVSCGVFICYYVLQLISNQSLEKEFDVKTLRQGILEFLISMSEVIPSAPSSDGILNYLGLRRK